MSNSSQWCDIIYKVGYDPPRGFFRGLPIPQTYFNNFYLTSEITMSNGGKGSTPRKFNKKNSELYRNNKFWLGTFKCPQSEQSRQPPCKQSGGASSSMVIDV